MKSYLIGGVSVTARSFRTYNRRLRGFERGELTVDGQTILAKDRTPAGTPMRKSVPMSKKTR
tara:strand:+ start:152138 stop:152323 length:186 start_codon:yes stop_codon:yes gene_type:complete